MAALSRFWEFWIRNTMRKVTIVVPVLMTSCQVSEKPNTGPVSAQTMMTAAANMNVIARPAACDAALAILAKACEARLGCMPVKREAKPTGSGRYPRRHAAGGLIGSRLRLDVVQFQSVQGIDHRFER